ncbi:MAG: 50S ribosomal protein L5 [Candidatus Magasanikbacteria bacterium]|nr:50S ribosomal protein L5 [Candidatus Magasanikbacteria bacterium]
MTPNLYNYYKKEVVPALKKEFGFKNVMQVPKITKVVINVGVGKFLKEPNFIENVEKNLAKITGQKPVRTKSKKAISNFKIRENMDIGVVVSLRGAKMYYFLEKLLDITLPRTRDFRGISDKAFDGRGNYSLGFKENVAFPEIKAGEAEKTHGMQINIATNAKNKEQGRALLMKLGFPFVK